MVLDLQKQGPAANNFKTSFRDFLASGTFSDWHFLSQVTRKVVTRSPQVVMETTQANTMRRPQQFQVSNVPKTQVATSGAQTTASKLMTIKAR